VQGRLRAIKWALWALASLLYRCAAELRVTSSSASLDCSGRIIEADEQGGHLKIEIGKICSKRSHC
jgi:hypothetical protein